MITVELEQVSFQVPENLEPTKTIKENDVVLEIYHWEDEKFSYSFHRTTFRNELQAIGGRRVLK